MSGERSHSRRSRDGLLDRRPSSSSEYWRRTRDPLFIWFALAFAVDAITRVALGLGDAVSEQEPLIYLARLVTFALIVAAVIQKNRGGKV